MTYRVIAPSLNHYSVWALIKTPRRAAAYPTAWTAKGSRIHEVIVRSTCLVMYNQRSKQIGSRVTVCVFAVNCAWLAVVLLAAASLEPICC